MIGLLPMVVVVAVVVVVVVVVIVAVVVVIIVNAAMFELCSQQPAQLVFVDGGDRARIPVVTCVHECRVNVDVTDRRQHGTQQARYSRYYMWTRRTGGCSTIKIDQVQIYFPQRWADDKRF